MSSLSLWVDPIEYTRELENGGFTPEQALALYKATKYIHIQLDDSVFRELEEKKLEIERLKAEISILKTKLRLQNELWALESRLNVNLKEKETALNVKLKKIIYDYGTGDKARCQNYRNQE